MLNTLLLDTFHLFFPKVCEACQESLKDGEELICLNCRFDLPFTHFTVQKANSLEQSFTGRVSIAFGTALFYYESKGLTQALIHQLKYHDRQELGALFGDWMVEELLQSKRTPEFDCVIPVPLHKEKLKSRGYNQVALFGQKIAQGLGIEYNDTMLQRKLDTVSQTGKSRLDRFENLKDKFFIIDGKIFENKHILLVDDVITTGATIEACILQLNEINGIKISVATIAFTA